MRPILPEIAAPRRAGPSEHRREERRAAVELRDGSSAGPTPAVEDAAALRRLAATWPGHQLTPGQSLVVELLLSGALAPRTGFSREDPLTLTAPVEVGTTLALREEEGATVAALHVEDAWVDDAGRPQVSGAVQQVEGVVHHDFRPSRPSPADVRALMEKNGWNRLLAYQPRHVVTQEQADALLAAAHKLDAALLLQPLHAGHLVGDLAWYARARSAVLVGELLAEDLGEDRFVLALTPDPGGLALASRIAANYGATHLALDAGEAVDLDPAARGLEVVQLPASQTATLQPAVAAELAALRPPPDRAGLTVFFTGFSGSGKSTVAKVLAARLMEIGPRRVTLLDGDVVRRHLSSELTFSREHRDLNIRRIGYVASEVTRHGGIAIAAPIAPYDATRRDVRAMVQQFGGFVLVHVATPLEVCEQRDRKGLYARARSGDLPSFTGISDPYEDPADAELVIDTSEGTVEDAVETVIRYLRGAGWLPR